MIKKELPIDKSVRVFTVHANSASNIVDKLNNIINKPQAVKKETK